nr:hypothetical protein [Planctomycetales bacterium]
DLVLADDHLPELHSYLLLTPESAVIRHLGGGPGLSVDGQPQTRAILTDRSRIQIGPYEFTIHIASPSATLATRTQTVRGGAGRLSPVATDVPAGLTRQPAQVLQNVATFLDSWSSEGGPSAWSRGPLSGKPPAAAGSGLPLPVSVGLVAPCVKPPPWRHMAATA